MVVSPEAVAAAPARVSGSFRAWSWIPPTPGNHDVHQSLVEHQDIQAVLDAIRAGHSTWVAMLGRCSAAEFVLGGDGLRIHPLIIEDVFEDCPRPRVENLDDYMYVQVHAPSARSLTDADATLDLIEIDVLVGPNWVVTHSSTPSAALAAVQQELQRSGRGLRKGPAWLAHMVIDRIVDDYMPLLDEFDQELSRLDDDVLDELRDDVLPRIFGLKRNLQQLRRLASHQKEVLHRLGRGDFEIIPEALLPFFRDVYDHFSRVSDLADGYREQVTSAFEAHMAMQSNRMNAVMKTLTLATTIFMPLSFLAGLYGMNFKFMPELETRWGYPLVLVVMGVIATSIFAVYRRKRWL